MNTVSASVTPPSRTAACWVNASKYSSNLARSCPPSTSPNWLDHSLQVYLQSRSITASKFAPSRPPISYLHTRSITAFNFISKLAWSWPPSVSQNLLDCSPQVRTVTASKLARSQPRNASLSLLDHAVVKRCSYLAHSPSSSLCCTSHGIRREFLRISGSGSMIIGRGWEYTWPWWTTQIAWITECLARVCEMSSWET